MLVRCGRPSQKLEYYNFLFTISDDLCWLQCSIAALVQKCCLTSINHASQSLELDISETNSCTTWAIKEHMCEWVHQRLDPLVQPLDLHHQKGVDEWTPLLQLSFSLIPIPNLHRASLNELSNIRWFLTIQVSDGSDICDMKMHVLWIIMSFRWFHHKFTLLRNPASLAGAGTVYSQSCYASCVQGYSATVEQWLCGDTSMGPELGPFCVWKIRDSTSSGQSSWWMKTAAVICCVKFSSRAGSW